MLILVYASIQQDCVLPLIICILISGVLCLKQVSRTWISNCIPQYMWDVLLVLAFDTCLWHNTPDIYSACHLCIIMWIVQLFLRMCSGCHHKLLNIDCQYLWSKTNTSYLLYPPHNEVVGGVYWFHSVRPSVCPSVRPSVRPSVPHAVSALYHLQLWMDSFHIRHKWSLPWEGVSCTMTFDLDLYLQGHLALT